MYLDEKKSLDAFSGSGEKNKAGEDLLTFLKKYNPSRYQNPSNTVDMAIFACDAQKRRITKVLLIQRGNHPSIGWWALPGGFVEYRENLETAAARELSEETGIEHIEFEQLKTYGAYDRDPRTRIITTAYVALVPEGLLHERAGDDASAAGWFDINAESSGVQEQDAGKLRQLYTLKLNCQEAGVCTESVVSVTWKGNSVIQNKTYRTEQTSMLASDHSAIILEGYHYLSERLAAMP